MSITPALNSAMAFAAEALVGQFGVTVQYFRSGSPTETFSFFQDISHFEFVNVRGKTTNWRTKQFVTKRQSFLIDGSITEPVLNDYFFYLDPAGRLQTFDVQPLFEELLFDIDATEHFLLINGRLRST